MAEKKFGNLKDVTALVVGAGEAGSLVAEELMRRGAGTIHVANRTFESSRELAEKVGGKAIPLEQLYNEVKVIDLGVFAVSVDEPLLTLEKTRHALVLRKRDNRMLIDISQPRCIQEGVDSLPTVDFRNIDDMKSVVEENIKQRSLEAEKARRIVLDELRNLETPVGRMLSKPLVSALRITADRKEELRKALRMVGDVSQKQKVVIENLTKELAERIAVALSLMWSRED